MAESLRDAAFRAVERLAPFAAADGCRLSLVSADEETGELKVRLERGSADAELFGRVRRSIEANLLARVPGARKVAFEAA